MNLLHTVHHSGRSCPPRSAFLAWNIGYTMAISPVRTVLFTLFIAHGLSAIGQVPHGRYAGALSRDGSVQLMSLRFAMNAGRLEARYDIPELGIYDVACDTTAFAGDSLFIRFFYGAFHGRYFPATEEITGISEGWQPKIRSHVKRAAEEEKPYVPMDITFHNGDVRLEGTLFAPKNAGPYPVVIMIHGSDAQDRTTWYYRSLGYLLAQRGIGAFLYDKRGCGASSGSFEAASFDDLASDAVAAYDALRANPAMNISRIGYLGTSQGGWVAPIAANRTPGCAFLVLNVGPSVPVFDQDVHRVRYGMLADGLPTAAIDSAVAYTRLYFAYVRSNKAKDRKAVERMAASIRPRDWSSFVNLDLADEDLAWWRRNDHDPAASLRALRCPTLSIFGELDPLVPPQENRARMEDLLTAAGVDHRIVVLPGCGHDARTFQGLNGNDWDWPRVYWQWRTQPREFIDSIVDLILGH